MPKLNAFLAAFSAATWAAKGVAFLEPLKPTTPVEDQHRTFPCESVMVTMVLLKVAWTWAIPLALWTFGLLRDGACAITYLSLCLGRCRGSSRFLGRPGRHESATGTLSGPGVGVGPLAADGEPPPVP